jgi:hypothetical protein
VVLGTVDDLGTGEPFDAATLIGVLHHLQGDDAKRAILHDLASRLKPYDDTKVVVGHGPLARKADIAEFHDMLVTSRDRIEKLFNQGKTEQEVIALEPLADLDAKWAEGSAELAVSHIRNVYNSFKRL